uniref:Uncharacterized protein n=1 Tax=Anguilla anguilla TaxID=7936 RepID=A0A0E9UD93_ANGAN
MELEAINVVAQLCQQYQVRCHIVHLSSAQPLEVIQAARQAGAPSHGGDHTPLPHPLS